MAHKPRRPKTRERSARQSTGQTSAIWQPYRFEQHAFGLPALVRPEGSGYMPLYLAAQWIATRGGTIDIDPRDIMIWKDAFATLLARMASGEVAVVGIRDGKNEKIDGHLFARQLGTCGRAIIDWPRLPKRRQICQH